jgi:anti-sigma factor RsiW
MTRHHLTDSELLAQHFDRRGAGVHEHLAACTTCQERSRAITELLDDVNQAAAREADALFGPEVLARQQARIMGRIAHECRSARVISFPASAPPPVRHARTGTRWVAAAVAAGVILGIVGEHVSHRITRTPYQARSFETVAVPVAVQPVRAMSVRTVSASDDDFYGQVELAFGSAGPAALRSLDALTPRASDVRE